MFPQPAAWHDLDSLRAFARGALHGIEHGLRAEAEGFDCGGGTGELLARDALGATVVVVVASAGDRTLVGRVAAAHEFLARNPGLLSRILPDRGFDPRLTPRILVLSPGIAGHALEALRRLAIEGLEAFEVEGFQLDGASRTASRRILGHALPEPCAAGLGASLAAAWTALGSAFSRLDPTLFVDGDRHARRVLLGGRLLASYAIDGGSIHGQVPGGAVHRILDAEGAHAFVDVVIRRYAAWLAGGSEVARREPGDRANPGQGADVEAIRQHLAAARLTSDG